jgi:hypothetical protein
MAEHDWIRRSDESEQSLEPSPGAGAQESHEGEDLESREAGTPGENRRERQENAAAEASQREREEDEETVGIALFQENNRKGQSEEDADRSTVPEVQGRRFDCFKVVALLAVLDIASPAKRVRLKDGPQFFHLVRPVTIIGTGKRAKIRLDDPAAIKPEHAAIAFQQSGFHIYPQEGSVVVDGKSVEREGGRLSHGSRIEVGSARLLFLVAQ